MSPINFCRTISILIASSFMSTTVYAVEVWNFYSNVENDSSKWSNHGTYPQGGGAMIASMMDNKHVFIWANEDYWSSAGRTVQIPNLSWGICQASIEHTGYDGNFYVRDSATYTTLTTPVRSTSGGYTVHSSDKNYWTDVKTPNFFANDKKVFARFIFTEGKTFYPLYNPSGPATSRIDDLRITCI